ncbi:MAG TPA: hypothetical protein VFW39_10580 [Sphingomicrobium sp.]|nr:hypothetical protein [Sphingomicrobium sp.]
MKHSAAFCLVLALASCGPPHKAEHATNNAAAPVLPAASAPPGVSNTPAPATVANQAAASKEQTAPTVDPKSPEAAELLVASFASLLNRGKLAEAYMLLGPGASPRSEFDARFSAYSHLKVRTGKAGQAEGAAGSIYIEVPLTISGTEKGKRVERSASAVLRRVNDVPGSTEEQRHWHIERIDWKEAP